MNLTIYGPINNETIDYEWNEATTTFGMLLNHVITTFHLGQIEYERIRLIAISDACMDLPRYSDMKMSVLGLRNNSSISIKILDPRQDNVCVNIQCTNPDRTSALYVPPTNTIAELNKKIENCLCIVPELYTQTNVKLDFNDYFRTLEQLDVQPGQTIYARPQLSTYPPIMIPARNQIPLKDKVIIKCQVSSSETVHITASVQDTIVELRRRIAFYQKDKSLTPLKFRSGNIIIDDTQLTRCLFDFGIKSGSIIDAEMNGFNQPIVSSDVTPIGLKNKRNSCFMNSALQCLVHVIPLTQYFLESSDHSRDSSRKVTAAYAKLLYQLQRTDRSNEPFLPTELREAMSCIVPSFGTARQQDAQEFLNSLLNAIHEELKLNNPSKRQTIIEDLFYGKIKSLITCLQCNTVTENEEQLQFISLPLSRQQREFTIEYHLNRCYRSKTNVLVCASGRIEHLVKAFLDKRGKIDLFDRIIVQTTESDEPLDFNSPLYMLTNSEVRMIKQKERIERIPPIQLKINPKKITLYECLREFISIEYLQDEWFCREGECEENTRATKQIQICALPPILIIQLKRFTSEDGVQKKIETFVEYPINGLDLRNPSTSPHDIYDLIAVSNHSGSIDSGHYTAFARRNVNSTAQWYKFDDAVVSTVASESEIVTANAYLLFYMKRNY